MHHTSLLNRSFFNNIFTSTLTTLVITITILSSSVDAKDTVQTNAQNKAQTKEHAQQTGHNAHKGHHSAFGTHGMALMLVDDKLIASHMPLHNSMHEHQIIFTTKIDQNIRESVLNLLKNNQLVTIQPEKFDLIKLQNGELKSFSATVFTGHFERGGKPTLTEIIFNVEQMLLDRNIEYPRKNGQYVLLPINENSTLAVHQIATKPSYDHIVHLSGTLSNQATNQVVKQAVKLATTGKQLTQSELTTIEQVKGLKWQKSLYLETRDFVLR